MVPVNTGTISNNKVVYMRILLLEDDNLIGDGLKTGLTKCGFNVDWFTDGLTGQQALQQAPFDAVILDLGLPEIDGIDILTYWRENNCNVPVLILTARDALQNRLAGLNAGADDYLCKPFALSEVVARLNALIRRSHDNATSLLKFRNITFDMTSRITTCDGKEVVLTAREQALLLLFLNNKNRVMSRSFIEEKLYSWDSDVESNAVEVHIHNLRRKLGNSLINTVRSVGYILAKENEET